MHSETLSSLLNSYMQEDVEPYYEAYTQLGKLINNDKEFQVRVS